MITHVAIRFQGKVYSMPPPNRHHDVIRLIVEQTGAKTGEQYARRKPALRHALECGQCKPDCLGARLGELYSEDVW